MAADQRTVAQPREPPLSTGQRSPSPRAGSRCSRPPAGPLPESSAVRSGDGPGQILPDAERELEDTSLLEINLPPLPDFPAGQVVPVQINSVVTELGTLELWMKHTNSDRRWKVEFQVRTE